MSATDSEDMVDAGFFTARMRKLTLEVPPNVLVVDDDTLELELISDRLERCGLNVKRATDGIQALQLLEQEEFSVVLLDWQMPVMTGIELAERLRASGKDDIYIIMLTVRDSGFDHDRGYRAGVDDYLTKKLYDTEVMARIHAAFNTVGLRCELKRARARIAELEARCG